MIKKRMTCKNCGERKGDTEMIMIDYGKVRYFCNWVCLSEYSTAVAETKYAITEIT